MPSTYTLISSNTLSSSAASVTFSAIPSTYTDLVLRISARTLGSGGVIENVKVTLNSVITNYSYTELQGNGASVSSGRATSFDAFFVLTNTNTSTGNTLSSCEVYIPSYLTSQVKVASLSNVMEANATTAYIQPIAGLTNITAAISSIALTPAANSFVTRSSFYLYGIKNS
jgi:hypothetical protein